MKGKIIFVEGIPGAGKSLFCKSYEKYENAVTFGEWVDEQILADYIADMPNKATEFQFRAQHETFKTVSRAQELAQEGKIVLIDRGIYGNLVFATLQFEKGFISEANFKLYRSRVEHNMRILNSLETIKVEHWFLQCDPKIALQRIAKRNRNGESKYAFEYLEALDYKHHQILQDKVTINVNNEFVLNDNILSRQDFSELLDVYTLRG